MHARMHVPKGFGWKKIPVKKDVLLQYCTVLGTNANKAPLVSTSSARKCFCHPSRWSRWRRCAWRFPLLGACLWLVAPAASAAPLFAGSAPSPPARTSRSPSQSAAGADGASSAPSPRAWCLPVWSSSRWTWMDLPLLSTPPSTDVASSYTPPDPSKVETPRHASHAPPGHLFVVVVVFSHAPPLHLSPSPPPLPAPPLPTRTPARLPLPIPNPCVLPPSQLHPNPLNAWIPPRPHGPRAAPRFSRALSPLC